MGEMFTAYFTGYCRAKPLLAGNPKPTLHPDLAHVSHRTIFKDLSGETKYTLYAIKDSQYIILNIKIKTRTSHIMQHHRQEPHLQVHI